MNLICLILSIVCLFVATLIGFQVIDNPGWQADFPGWLALGLTFGFASFLPWGNIRTGTTRVVRREA